MDSHFLAFTTLSHSGIHTTCTPVVFNPRAREVLGSAPRSDWAQEAPKPTRESLSLRFPGGNPQCCRH